MSITRQAALEKIRRHPLQATPRLVEQGFVHTGQLAVGAPFHHRDIDFWAATSDRQAVTDLFHLLGAQRLSSTRRSEWLNHDVFLLECSDGSLLVDVKFGDLKVGALTLLSESELLWSLDEDNRISGAAQIADQMLRRLACGKAVDSSRLEIVRSVWQELTGVARDATINGYQRRFGKAAAMGIRDLLEGREPSMSLARSLRLQVVGAYFSSFAALRTAASKAFASTAAWITRRPKPFGQPQRGTLTVISGTDGTGKSATLDNVREHLQQHGLRCKTFYLGRSRGDVPDVATSRNVVGRRAAKVAGGQDVYRVSPLSKVASWLHAVEYALRTLRPRFYALFLGYSVLCDRYCYDIALIPGGSAWALRFARWLCPNPDVNVVLHAPPDVILEGKAERDRATIERQQTILAEIVAGNYAREAGLLIDTSTTDAAATRRLITREILALCQRDYL